MFGGWYVVGIREDGAVIALIAGPWQDRSKAESLFPAAQKAADGQFSLRAGDTYGIAYIALPAAVPGKCNVQLWVTAEWTELR